MNLHSLHLSSLAGDAILKRTVVLVLKELLHEVLDMAEWQKAVQLATMSDVASLLPSTLGSTRKTGAQFQYCGSLGDYIDDTELTGDAAGVLAALFNDDMPGIAEIRYPSTYGSDAIILDPLFDRVATHLLPKLQFLRIEEPFPEKPGSAFSESLTKLWCNDWAVQSSSEAISLPNLSKLSIYHDIGGEPPCSLYTDSLQVLFPRLQSLQTLGATNIYSDFLTSRTLAYPLADVNLSENPKHIDSIDISLLLTPRTVAPGLSNYPGRAERKVDKLLSKALASQAQAVEAKFKLFEYRFPVLNGIGWTCLRQSSIDMLRIRVGIAVSFIPALPRLWFLGVRQSKADPADRDERY
ncbi:hypothetical protein DL89DRAFT_281109 [Linderina pennispora]|uniref:Uncharacterized protein n=1 Tax=Linderina pennispora TaxID=61395 RepID=A0A1Y1WNG5_9FUNG|nr:uncharacterized protein DL89DRAFT_281109 [Linderina pennispora]ORX74776.1 hypothetical protein DL89DRAFT_281109 [Linderina pennispora]